MNKVIISAGLFFVVMLSSCMSKNIAKYYKENRGMLDSLEQSYKNQYSKGHFSIEYIDKSFKNISIEIYTDSLKYIYVFGADEPRLKDTLTKYKLNTNVIASITERMKEAKCNWINNLDYYVDGQKHNLVFLSIRPRAFHFPFSKKRYYILTYFPQPQYFDSEGRLLDRRKVRRLRKINEDVFRRINDRVAYTISDRFR